MSDIDDYSKVLFDRIRRIDDDGGEYWSAREIARLLEYKDYRNFLVSIDKAMEACKNSGQAIPDHFGEATDMVDIGSGARRKLNDYHLTRYACYLIVQNANPDKEVVALGQTYFAVQTRRQELRDEYDSLGEDEKRLAIRNELKSHNTSLASAAKQAGVETSLDYAVFQNKGYQGLYGGLTAKDIHTKKKLKKSHDILDYMGSEELAANLFRATQTDAKLRRERVKGKLKANALHYEVGKKVRSTIADIGGTMPEKLPTPEKSIKQLERQERKIDV